MSVKAFFDPFTHRIKSVYHPLSNSFRQRRHESPTTSSDSRMLKLFFYYAPLVGDVISFEQMAYTRSFVQRTKMKPSKK